MDLAGLRIAEQRLVSQSMNYFYLQNETPIGPISEADIRTMFVAGNINETTLICQEGGAGWFLAGLLAGDIPPLLPKAAPVLAYACPKCQTSISPQIVQERNGCGLGLVGFGIGTCAIGALLILFFGWFLIALGLSMILFGGVLAVVLKKDARKCPVCGHQIG